MGWGYAPGMSRAAISPNGRVLRHPGDLEWLERRRLQAADLFAQGRTKAEVAGELGVSAQTASRWYARWRGGGAAGMRTIPGTSGASSRRCGGACSARPASRRARRGRDRPVGRPGVAADCANARTRRAWLCFVDESDVKPTPPVRRTWAPKGRMPVLRHPYRRGKQISMCGLVAYRPGQDDQDEPAAWMGFDLLEAPTTPGSSSACWTGWATSSATSR
jgi:hypothetical protein